MASAVLYLSTDRDNKPRRQRSVSEQAENAQIATLRQQVQTAEGTIAAIREQAHEQAQKAQGTIATLHEQVQTAQGTIATLREQLQTAQDTIATLHEEAEDAKNKAEARVSIVALEVAALERQAAGARDEAKQCHAQCRALQLKMDEALRQKDAEIARKDDDLRKKDLESKITAYMDKTQKQQVAELTAQVEALQDKNQDLQSQLDAALRSDSYSLAAAVAANPAGGDKPSSARLLRHFLDFGNDLGLVWDNVVIRKSK